MSRLDRKRLRHIARTLRQGPTEAGYAFFRSRRRRRNLADHELELPSSDALALSPLYDLEPEHLRTNAAAVRAYEELERLDIGSIQWFLPWFHLVHGGGIHTVLRFADAFAREHGVVNRFAVYDRDDPAAARDVATKIERALPGLRGVEVTAGPSPTVPCDAAIATTWESAYPLVRFTGARGKFFFLQDWEPDFHPAGSASALLDQVPRFELPAIVNTPGLADAYRAAGGRAVAFTPAVDDSLYHPPAQPRGEGPLRVFFYGRPSVARNAFALGLVALRRVKARYGPRVDIVCAGEDWSPGQYGVADVLRNEGMLEDRQAVAQLYRSCDVGLVFMLTRHPSYQPLEFMASGMVTVSNRNAWTSWLLHHEHNALLADPLPALVAEQLARLIEDGELRSRLREAGLRQASATTWSEQIEQVWAAITKRGPGFA